MTMRISQRDLEAISAYLDGQLPERERARLEARLKTDSGLREAYEQLHHTRAVLRSLPVMRAPRNFALTPQMVQARQSPPPAYPVLRLASVLATLMFVLVMVGDLMTPRGVALAPVLEAPAGERSALTQEPVETAAPFLQSAPAAEPEAESQKTMAEDQAESPEEPAPGIMEFAAPTPAPTETILLAPPAAALEATEEVGASGVEQQEQETAEAPAPDAGEEAGVTGEEQQTAVAAVPTWNYWRVLEVVFAIIALATGLAAAIFRRGMAG